MWVSRSLGMHTKPVVVLDVDGVYAPLLAQLALLVERGFVRPEGVDAIAWTTTVADAIDALDAGLTHPVRLVPTTEELAEGAPDD